MNKFDKYFPEIYQKFNEFSTIKFHEKKAITEMLRKTGRNELINIKIALIEEHFFKQLFLGKK